MNKVILMGRLTREPDVRYSQNSDGSMAVARYTLAVDRRRARTNSDGAEQTADYEHGHIYILPVLDGSESKIPFTEKSRKRREADH